MTRSDQHKYFSSLCSSSALSIMLRQVFKRGSQALGVAGKRWQTSEVATSQQLWAPLSKEAHEKMIELGVEVDLPVVDLNGPLTQLLDMYPGKEEFRNMLNAELKTITDYEQQITQMSQPAEPINWAKVAEDFNEEFAVQQKAFAEALAEACEELPPLAPVMDEEGVREMKNMLVDIEDEIETVDKLIIDLIAIWKEIYEYFARLDHKGLNPDLERRLNPDFAREFDKDRSQDINYSATYFFEGLTGVPDPPRFHTRRWQVGLDKAMEEFDLPNPAPNSSYPPTPPSTQLEYDIPKFWMFERYNQLMHQRAGIPYDGPDRKYKNPGKNIYVHDLENPVGSF